MYAVEKLKTQNYFIIAFLLCSILFLTFSVVIKRHYEDSQKLNAWSLQDGQIVRQSRKLLFEVLNMETGIRGYLLTGRADFLAPYDEAIKQMPDEINQLRLTLAQDDASQADLNDWLEQITTLENLMNRQMHHYNNGDHSAFALSELVKQKKQMDSLRQTLETYIQHRVEVLHEREQLSEKEGQTFIFILALGTVSSIVVMAFATFLILALQRRASKANEEIAKSEERLLLIMNGINDGLYDIYPTENRAYFSPAFQAMLGYSDDTPLDLPTFDSLIHPDDAAKSRDVFNRYAKKEMSQYNNVFRVQHKNGQWRWFLSRGIGFWDKNQIMTRFLGTHTDITEHKKREEALQEINKELETFTYIASHDLRSPLVNIKGFAKEMKNSTLCIKEALHDVESVLSEETKKILHTCIDIDIPEALGFIEKSTERMDTLTTAVLDLSRIGRREYYVREVNVEDIIKKCLAAQAYEISAKGVEVNCAPLPPVMSDALAVEQVFSNVLDNAIKYLDDKRPGRIDISATEDRFHSTYCIRDNGRGIEDADQKKIFELFRRARNTGTVRGSGMGMSFVRATLRKIGGSIWYESIVNQGTAFYIRLPKNLSTGAQL